MGCNFLEHPEPLAGDASFVQQEASNIAARTRQTGDYAGADRVRHLDEYDRSSASFLLQRLGRRGRVRKDEIQFPIQHQRRWLGQGGAASIIPDLEGPVPKG